MEHAVGVRPAEARGGVAALAESAVDNPLHEAGRAPPTGRALREVQGAEPICDAIFLGVEALALIQAHRVMLHILMDAAANPVLLVDNQAGGYLHASDASPDGAVLCLGDARAFTALVRSGVQYN